VQVVGPPGWAFLLGLAVIVAIIVLVVVLTTIRK